MSFSIVRIEDVDIPFAELAKKNPDIYRFAAGAIIFGYSSDHPGIPHILMCQRSPSGKDDNGNPKANSFPGCYEPNAGGHENKDYSIVSTMVREVQEETQLRVYAASHRVYRLFIPRKDYNMVKYMGIMKLREDMNCQRLWCDKQQKSVGLDEKPIMLRADEHIDYCWATEAQIRSSILFDKKETDRPGLVMLKDNKDILLDAFLWLKSTTPDYVYLVDGTEYVEADE